MYVIILTINKNIFLIMKNTLCDINKNICNVLFGNLVSRQRETEHAQL